MSVLQLAPETSSYLFRAAPSPDDEYEHLKDLESDFRREHGGQIGGHIITNSEPY
jgi:hypothetical protein